MRPLRALKAWLIQLPASLLRLVEVAAPQAEFISAEEVVASLRMQKDETELASMRKAVHIAQQALLNTLPHFRMGMSEQELAAELIVGPLGHGRMVPATPEITCGG